ncbi:FHA domain-containing protein [Synechococcus sp. PCC 6312]|uniref:FHA domain-containing protein n=1 Tax=Synechococcus sp. (strain ATCC 27167 / PCC 6312) TaxID=195253 RepID=UPI00029F47F9|nr:FHA domain-containing protein [Synechococcus sp. PCC 6312]AFY61273.1 FHA domain-containing protein [Synechococcus sp. PCC 6312]
MIICPTCQHPNPDHALQCENCFSALPQMNTCPNCQAPVQADASFCGQCGFNLRQIMAPPPDMPPLPDLSVPLTPPFTDIPELSDIPELNAPEPLTPVSTLPRPPIPPPPSVFSVPSTPLVEIKAQLYHIQTKIPVPIPTGLAVIHIGKPNDRIPPNIDLSGFPNSEIVSRIHADLCLDGETILLEDVGSANGTYVNNQPLPPGNRYSLKNGDRIAFGKGDLVTFIFQIMI